MNMIKKLTALILAVTILIVPSVYAAGNSENDISDYGKGAYDFLMAVGAMDQNEIAYDATKDITRAHFVKLALHLSNDAPNVLVSNEEIFSDVDSSTEYEAYIETAFKLSYISGSTGSAFSPDEIITLSQALKILVNILGYGHVAELSGGYPAGYYSVAQSLDLTDGMTADSALGLKMSDAMVLLKNASDADIMQIVSFGDGVSFEAKDGETLLTERHKISSAEGIITANAYTEIYAQDSGLDKNQIMLGDVVYNTSDETISSLIGTKVTLYFEDDDSKAIKNAVFAEISEDNMLIKAKSEDVEADGKILTVYDENDNSKNYKFSNGVSYIVNGKMAAMALSDLSGIKHGEITLISNDGDKTVDVALVTKYDSFIVAGVDSASGIVAANDGTLFELDSESDKYSFSVMKDGAPSGISDIKVDDSILVCQPYGNGYFHISILLSDKKITGAFSEIGDDYAVIGKETFELGNVSAGDITLGKTYTVIIDAFNRICHIENHNDTVYGFLYAVAKEGMDDFKCRIFTENNRWVDLVFADKVKYTDASVHKESKILSSKLYDELVILGDSVKQLVRYNVNSDAELISLELASTEHGIDSGNMNEATENNIFALSYSGSLRYRSVGAFDGRFFIDSGTKIFNIPSDYDKSKFSVKQSAAFSHDQLYAVTAYDVDDMLSCGALVVSGIDSDVLYHTDRFMVVTGKGMKFNSDEDAVPSIVGYRNGKEISIPVNISETEVTQDTYNAIKKGNLIISKFDEKGNISYLQTYDISSDYLVWSKSGSYWDMCTVLGGEVTNIDYSLKRIRITYSETGDETGFIYANSTLVQIYDKSEGTVVNGSASSIIPGDTIYAKMRYLNCNEIIIVRE